MMIRQILILFDQPYCEAAFNGKTNWNYIQTILRNWRHEGISTLRQVEERREERTMPIQPM